MGVNTLIQFRKGSDWTSDPILASGEPGFDTANNILKIGDGSKTWSELSPIGAGTSTGSGTNVSVTGSAVLDDINITGVGNVVVSLGQDNLLAISGIDGFSFRGYEDVTSTKTVFDIGQNYNSGELNVYYNGLKLLISEDYSANGGTTFTLAENAVSGDIIEWVGGYTGSSFFQDIGGSGTANYVTKWSDKNTITSGTIYDDGKVGIGTSSPSFLLDVNGSGNINLLKINDQYTFPTGVGNAGDSLVYDGSNQIIWSGIISHPTINAASDSDNSGRTYIQDIFLDSYGHITGIATATETVVDTNTETLTALSGDSVNTKLIYVDESGTSNDIDLSWAMDDTNLARLTSGTINNDGIATFSRDDGTSFNVDFSVLFDDTNLSRITTGNFDTSNGTLTLTRALDDTTFSINFDGRYLQSGDNVSELFNDIGYVTSGDFPLSGQLVNDIDLNNYNIIGTGNIIISGDITASTGLFDTISFNVDNESILSKGEISWSDTEGSLTLGLTDNTTVSVGESRYLRIRNETGGTLYKGQVVYATGVHSNGLITPDLYVADGSIREIRFMGVVLEDVNQNSNGYALDFGQIIDMDLDGSASNYAVGDETWVAGDILYVHPTVAGKLTKVEPKHSISVAIVLDPGNGNGNGRMFVRPTSYGHLDDNHDVSVSGVTNGQFLQYDSSTEGWVPSSSGNFTTLQVNGTAVPNGVGTIGFVTKWAGNNILGTGVLFDNGTNIGIGITNPLYAKLHLRSQYTAGTNYNLLVDDSSAIATGVGGGITFGGLYNSAGAYTDFAEIKSFRETDQDNDARSSLIFSNLGSDGLFSAKMIINSNGNVGIGRASPSYKLDVAGSGHFDDNISVGLDPLTDNFGLEIYKDEPHIIQRLNDPSGAIIHGNWYGNDEVRFATIAHYGPEYSANSAFNIGPSGSVFASYVADIGIGTLSNDSLIFGTNNTERARINPAGNFGIGTDNPSAKLNVESGNVVFNDLGGNFDFRVEGDADPNLLVVDASSDKVGIGGYPDNGKLTIDFINTNDTGKDAIYIENICNSTANGSYQNAGIDLLARKIVNSGVTDTGQIIGLDAVATIDGDGHLNNSYGARTWGGIYINQSGTLTNAWGIQPRVINAGKEGSLINDARGIEILIDGDLYNRMSSDGITNAKALYIRSIKDATNKYGIYQEGSSDKNYFAGSVGIGTDSPSSKLTVAASNEEGICIHTTSASAQNFKIGRNTSNGTLVFKGSQSNFSAYEFRSTIGGVSKTVLQTDRLTGAITFNDQFTFPTGDGTNSQVLATDGNGNVAWSGVSDILSGFSDYEELTTSKQSFTVNGGYTVGSLDVYYNGLKLIDGEDYTATDGTTFSLASAGSINDIVEWEGHRIAPEYATIGNPGDYRLLTSNGSSTTINGESDLVYTPTGLGVGTTTPDYKLDVNGTFSANSINVNDQFTFPTTDGSADQVLVTNGNGVLSWQDQTGSTTSTSSYAMIHVFG